MLQLSNLMKKNRDHIVLNLKIVRRTIDSINSVLPSMLEQRSIQIVHYSLNSELLKSLDRQLRLIQLEDIDDDNIEETLFMLLMSSGRLITAWSEFIYDKDEFIKELQIFIENLNLIENQLGISSTNRIEFTSFLN